MNEKGILSSFSVLLPTPSSPSALFRLAVGTGGFQGSHHLPHNRVTFYTHPLPGRWQ